MDLDQLGSTVLIVLLVVLAVLGLLAIGVVVFVIVRFRPSVSAIVAMVGALAYGASPIDLISEGLVGPIGAIDDIGLLVAAAMFTAQQIRNRRGNRPDASPAGTAPRVGKQRPDSPPDVTIEQLPS